MKTMPAFQIALKNQEIRNFKGNQGQGSQGGERGEDTAMFVFGGAEWRKVLLTGKPTGSVTQNKASLLPSA